MEGKQLELEYYSPLHFLIFSLYKNYLFLGLIMRIPPFLIPLAVGAIIQWIKMVVDVISHKQKIWLSSFWKSGWFPSVHSGISSSITTLVWLEYWVTSMYFAICLIFAFLFWYDAANVRFEAGKHAKYINEIKDELRSFSFIDYKLQDLQERLGHTFVEVVWGIVVWCTITSIIYFFAPSFLPIIIG